MSKHQANLEKQATTMNVEKQPRAVTRHVTARQHASRMSTHQA
jgi:hypothetical protein